jgi:hypothetical protein
MQRYRSVLLAIVAAAVPASASAVTYTWPGASPCHLTLTVCVNSVAAGSVIEIATAGPIDESVYIYQSLVLRAAAGFKPAFAPGRYIHGGLVGPVFGPGPFNVTVEGLTLTDADLSLSGNGSGDASFVVRRMRLRTSDPAITSYIRVNGNNAGNLIFDIVENELQSRSDFIVSHALSVNVDGPTATGAIRFNRVTSAGDSAAGGIHASVFDGTLELDVFANEVRGNFEQYAIRIRELAGSASPPVVLRLVNNLVVGPGRLVGPETNGVGLFVGHAGLEIAVANNTITSTRGGFFLGRSVLDADPSLLTGTVRNNLVAFNDNGLYLNDGAGTGDGVSDGYNLVFGNNIDSIGPGPGTVTSDPRLESVAYPRLSAGSPAIDAADTVYAQLLLGLNGLPQVDLDGMRRTIGGGSLGVDIGAYEFGDESLVASKASAGGNNFGMIHPALNLRPTVRPVLTKNFSQNGVMDPFAIGTWYSGAFWSAFNQGLETMPAGTAMNVFVPGVGGAFGASYAHVATAANTSGHVTTLDQTFLNGAADAVVQVTSNWNASGSNIYNNHHIAAGSFGSGPNSWFILNQDFASMPENAGFNVYAQDPSPNAYVHTVADHNRILVALNASVLDHPLLNGVPCAQVHLTQKLGSVNDHPYDVYYQAGSWTIYNQDEAELPLGSEFYVLVNPRQVFECTDVIFEDGFQS